MSHQDYTTSKAKIPHFSFKHNMKPKLYFFIFGPTVCLILFILHVYTVCRKWYISAWRSVLKVICFLNVGDFLTVSRESPNWEKKPFVCRHCKKRQKNNNFWPKLWNNITTQQKVSIQKFLTFHNNTMHRVPYLYLPDFCYFRVNGTIHLHCL